MEITEVRVTLRSEEKLKAFASITFDDAFVIRGLKVISGKDGYFVSMPSRKRPDGTYQDVAHPINNDMRRQIEERVLDCYETELNKAGGSSEQDKAVTSAEAEPEEAKSEEAKPEEAKPEEDVKAEKANIEEQQGVDDTVVGS